MEVDLLKKLADSLSASLGAKQSHCGMMGAIVATMVADIFHLLLFFWYFLELLSSFPSRFISSGFCSVTDLQSPK
jgi:hypothetical protein